jgi:hypothetical protein
MGLPLLRPACVGSEYANSRRVDQPFPKIPAARAHHHGNAPSGPSRPQETLTGIFLVHTLNDARFAFDPAKDAINRSKHGVSLSEAARPDWNRVLAKLAPAPITVNRAR